MNEPENSKQIETADPEAYKKTFKPVNRTINF